MDFSIVQDIKATLVDATGLSRDALHIYGGLIVFILASLIFRKSFSSSLPFLAVVFISVLVEICDVITDIDSFGYWRWGASVHDIINTAFWPLVFLILARLKLLRSY